MATIQEAIKRLTYLFTSTGADKVAADLNSVGAAQANVAASAQTTTKASLDLEKSFENLEKRFQTTNGVQLQYAAIQDKVNQAVKQNPELQGRANDVLAAAAERFDKAKGSAGAMNSILDAGRGALLGYAAGIGPIGALLGSFGPVGIAAAASIGLVSNALSYMSENAAKIGQESSGLKQFSDITGLSVTQVRGLTEAGQELGVAGDTIRGSLEKFTVSLDDARKGAGPLYDQLEAIDKGLADQVASTHSGVEALDLLAKAYNSTTDATTRAALARAAFGRGGASVGPVLGAIADAGGVDAYSAAAEKALGVTGEWTKRVAELSNQNKALESDLELIKASVYTEDTLARQNKFLQTQIDIAKATKEFIQNSPKSIFGPGPTTDEFGQPFDFTLLNANKAASKAPAANDNGSAESASASNAATDAINAESAANESLTKARLEAKTASEQAATASGNLVALLGSAATGAEIAEAKFQKLTAAFLGNKFGAADSAAALELYQRALNGGSDNAIAALQDQRGVIEAIGGAAKMAAQEVADFNALMRTGTVSEAQAAAQAMEKQANAQAQVNAQAQATLISLQAQLPVVSAVTGQQQIQAQAAATLNQLLLQNVDSETAFAIASQQATNAQAAATASVEKQVEALKDQNLMIKAAGTGTEAQTAAAIAYKNAIASGADQTAAAALSSQTLANAQAQAAVSSQQIALSMADAAQASADAWQAADRAKNPNAGTFNPTVMPSGDLTFVADPNHPISYKGGGLGQNLDVGAVLAQVQQLFATQNDPANVAANFVGKGNYAGAISAVEKLQGNDAARMSQVDTLTQAQNTTTADKGVQISNLQAEMAWLNTLPETIARDQQIANLTQQIKQNTDATTGNTSALNASLNPLYNGRDALHVGYYKAATGLDVIAQGPTSGDQISFPLMVNGGERIRVTPAGQSDSAATNDNSKTVTNYITNNFGNVQPAARRSVRQFGQGFGQMAAALS